MHADIPFVFRLQHLKRCFEQLEALNCRKGDFNIISLCQQGLIIHTLRVGACKAVLNAIADGKGEKTKQSTFSESTVPRLREKRRLLMLHLIHESGTPRAYYFRCEFE